MKQFTPRMKQFTPRMKQFIPRMKQLDVEINKLQLKMAQLGAELDDATGKKKQYDATKSLGVSVRTNKQLINFLWGENRRLREELESECLWIAECINVQNNEVIEGLKTIIDKYFGSKAPKECEFCGHIPCGC